MSLFAPSSADREFLLSFLGTSSAQLAGVLKNKETSSMAQNLTCNVEENQLIVSEFEYVEDGDSRDSGISVSDVLNDDDQPPCILSPKTPILSRTPFSDRSNLGNYDGQQTSAFPPTSFNVDTPLCRPPAILEPDSDDATSSFDDGRRLSNASISSDHSTDSIGSRKRNCSEASSIGSYHRKRSKQIVVDENSPDDSFQHFDRLPQEANTSTHSLIARAASSESLNGRSRSRTRLVTRAMSTSCLQEKEHESPSLPKMLEVHYTLETVERPQRESQAFRSISAQTLLKESKRLGDDFLRQYTIVDCRYPFEYNGGHVKGAINVYEKSAVQKIFFPEESDNEIRSRIPIFYCEYSQKRGPSMANYLRSMDRIRNELSYPHVDYPEIYLIDLGYKNLWSHESCRDLCDPRSYLPMNAPTHTHHLRNFRCSSSRSIVSEKFSTTKRTTKELTRKNGSLFDISNQTRSSKKTFRSPSMPMSLSMSYLHSSSNASFEKFSLLQSTPNDGIDDDEVFIDEEMLMNFSDKTEKSVTSIVTTSSHNTRLSNEPSPRATDLEPRRLNFSSFSSDDDHVLRFANDGDDESITKQQ
ncbi:unnamed protein product [Caenorhabditis auriculariae]|uniref:M-phase inducer phosphatase n=1 Tax=Caenorhabditis auriculariae TaxID=2777116 RepID=A0A8S1GV89_9PELO|nr:unnamed protein product [Caenorhabditis auriculariae]